MPVHPLLRIREGCKRYRCLPDEWLRQDAELTADLDLAEAIESRLRRAKETKEKLAEQSKRLHPPTAASPRAPRRRR